MNRRDYEKQLLIQRIDAQRKLAALEMRGLKNKVNPIANLVQVGQQALTLASPLRSFARTLGGDEPAQRRRWIQLGAIAAGVLPVILALLRRR